MRRRTRRWVKTSWLRGCFALLCAVLVLSGSAYSLAQTPFAERFSERNTVDDPGGNDDIVVDPVENYTFVDESEYAGVLLRKTDDAGKDYINETLFIGDSNTARMNMYGFLTLDNCIGIESMGIIGAQSNKCVYFEGYSSPVTIADAVKMMKPRRIIVSFGTNDIAGLSTDTFISHYRAFIQSLQAAYAYTDIILAAVPPFAKSVERANFSIATVSAYNKALIDLAKEMGLTFLDTGEVFTATDGYIKPTYIYSDGIHITSDGYEAYFKYVRTHSHIVEDARPKPLGSIPKQKAAPKPVTEPKQKFDCGAAANAALGMLISRGFTAATSSTNMAGAEYINFSVPFAQATAGSESAIAANLYQFVISRTSKTTGYVSVGYSTDEDAQMHNFQVAIAPKECTHSWGDWQVTLVPTCTTAGTETRICALCGTSESRATNAKGHDYSVYIRRLAEPTETSIGLDEYKCSRCNSTTTVEVPMLVPVPNTDPVVPPAP